MAITLSSVFGGITDPYEADGPITDLLLQFEAVNEEVDFFDVVSINLTPIDPLDTFTAITNIQVGAVVEGLAVSLNDLTQSGSVELNINYVEPVVQNILSNISISTNIFNSNTEGNVEIVGKITGAFPDKFYQFKNLITDESFTTNSLEEIPDSEVNLHLYKASFMRYNTVLFYLNVTYNSTLTPTTTENFVLQKRVLNDWEIARLALISKLNTIGI